LSSGIKVAFSIVTISALVGFTLVSAAEGAVSWNGFLKQVGFNPPTVYEVSGSGIILEGEEDGQPFPLLCLDGDWLNDNGDIETGHRIEVDDAIIFDSISGITSIAVNIDEDETSRVFPRTVIGQSVSAQYFENAPGTPEAPFDIPFTATILCVSPSSFQTVGGEWQATDTTALIIGYSVLNMYWIAPVGIGIGLGIYLVKRRF